MAPAARLWYTLERACGVSPCTKLAKALSKNSLLRSVERNMQASSLALKSTQVFLQLGGYGVSPEPESMKQRASLT